MNPYNLRTHDLFDGDPTTVENGYHQDYREGLQPKFTNSATLIALVLAALPIIYHILFLLDYDVLPLPELLWNVLVYTTPTRLLDIVDRHQNPLRIADPARAHIPRTHAAKSATMRRVLGLDKPGGILSSVARVGGAKLSTLPGISTIVSTGDEGKPAGLGNWDNSCYQNSVLQGLASLDSLTGYLANERLDKVVEETEEGERPDMRMAEALKGLIATLNDPENNGRRIWTPATLKNMSSWQQQDAQEYFSKVLDEIDKEIGKAAALVRTSQGLEAEGLNTPGLKVTGSLPTSTIRNPLEGLIAQRVGCTNCGYSEGLSMTPFNCLTVPLANVWRHDLAECLDEYTKLELIEGVQCGKCTLLKTKRLLSIVLDRSKDLPDSKSYVTTKARLDAVDEALEEDDYEDKTLLNKCNIQPKARISSTKSRQAVIARPPKSLVIHINRSLFDEHTGDLRKNHSAVKFPKYLDLGSWCLGSSGIDEDESKEEWLLNPDQPMISSSRQPSRMRGPMYEIRGVVTHYGRHENGHYVCYRKHPVPVAEGEVPKEQWWRLSDDDVSRVSEESVLDQGGVFMLFYDCIEPASPAVSTPASEEIIPTVLPTTEVENSTTPFCASQVQDLELAAAIPLPAISDLDLDLSDTESQSSSSFFPTREESIATSVSETDEDDTINDENQDPNRNDEYQPTKAILVPKYVQHQQSGVQNKDSGHRDRVASGSLVMV